jgi:hypothetical protein
MPLDLEMDLKSNMEDSDWFLRKLCGRAADTGLDLNSYGLTAVDVKETGVYDINFV